MAGERGRERFLSALHGRKTRTFARARNVTHQNDHIHNDHPNIPFCRAILRDDAVPLRRVADAVVGDTRCRHGSPRSAPSERPLGNCRVITSSRGLALFRRGAGALRRA